MRSPLPYLVILMWKSRDLKKCFTSCCLQIILQESVWLELMLTQVFFHCYYFFIFLLQNFTARFFSKGCWFGFPPQCTMFLTSGDTYLRTFFMCYFVGLNRPEKNENIGILVIDSEWETHVFYITYKIWHICQKAILTFLFVEPTKAMGLLT